MARSISVGICTTQSYRLYVVRSFSSDKLSVTNIFETKCYPSLELNLRELISGSSLLPKSVAQLVDFGFPRNVTYSKRSR